MQFYNTEELAKILTIASLKLNKTLSPKGAIEIARRSRGTPRIALRLLKRVRDFADVAEESEISSFRANFALSELGVNEHGFDELDLKYLRILAENQGKPIGLSTLSAAMSEDESTIEDVIEPYLLANGYFERTAKGRIATSKTLCLFSGIQGSLF